MLLLQQHLVLSHCLLQELGRLLCQYQLQQHMDYHLVKKVIYEIVMQKFNKTKKQYQKDYETIKSFDIKYKESLQDNVI